MNIRYVKESIVEDLCEGPFVEFNNEVEDEKKWDATVESIKTFLLQFSHDEEAEDAPEGPGFLVQDIAQGSWSIGVEFNDETLLSRTVFEGLALILPTQEPSKNTNIIVTVYIDDSMQFIIIRRSEIIIPKIKKLKRIF